MSFLNLTQITNKLNEFSHTQSQNQQQMIALLKQISQQLPKLIKL